MIIVKISGGLGNQLLQYAFAKSLEQKRQIQVKIDASIFKLPTKNITPRIFLLDKFNINLQTAEKNDFHKIKVPYGADRSLKENIYRAVFKFREFLRPRNRKKIIIYHKRDFNELIFNSPDNSYISGVWTNQKYFIDIKETLIKEITPKFPLSDKSKKLLLKINGANSASIHIRRDDYLKHLYKLVLLSDDYYRKAVDAIKKKTKNPLFFVFSDDIEYVKTNYGKIFGADVIYVSGENIPDYEELWLMSRCKHNIIANSTFSWWGAWLNQNPDKIIIAPSQYTSDNTDISDFFPREWIIIN